MISYQWTPIDDDDVVVKVCPEEVAVMQRASDEWEARLLERQAEASQHQQEEQSRRSTQTQIYQENKNKKFADPVFKCPRCYYRNYYPSEQRSCNKLECGNTACAIKFCIACGKQATASCRCISAPWARAW